MRDRNQVYCPPRRGFIWLRQSLQAHQLDTFPQFGRINTTPHLPPNLHSRFLHKAPLNMLRSRSRSSTASPPSSPRAKRSTLSMAGIANIFIQMKRLQYNALRQTVVASGEPTTHPSIAEEAQTANRIDVEYDEEYICIGGVNLPTLLRASRNAMLDHCYGLAANLNALVDEQYVFSSVEAPSTNRL